MTVVRPVQASLLPDHAPDRPVGKILPSVITGTNADLIAQVAPYYLTGSVLDVTYGDGKWWDRFRPEQFTAHDLYKLDGVDFRALPEADSSVDTVCYDPPYTISGGPSSDKMNSDIQNRFGIGIQNVGHLTTRSFEELIRGGLTECCRVARRWVLVKCMEFAQGGPGLHDTPTLVTNHARSRGWLKHDQIVHHTGSGPGGHNIFEAKRARRHHSYLLVFTKAKP